MACPQPAAFQDLLRSAEPLRNGRASDWVIVRLAGVMGWWLRTKRASLPAVVALAMVSVAEPLALWTHIDHLDAHLAYMGVATGAWRFH